MRIPYKDPTFVFRVVHGALLGALGYIDYDRSHIKDVRGHRAESLEDAHVEHIRNKLGHQSRAQVASWATAQGLVSDPTGGRQ